MTKDKLIYGEAYTTQIGIHSLEGKTMYIGITRLEKNPKRTIVYEENGAIFVYYFTETDYELKNRMLAIASANIVKKELTGKNAEFARNMLKAAGVML